MADKYDQILQQFFTGSLDIAIKEREANLISYHPFRNENVGGGKTQSNYKKSVENTLIKLESDNTLNKL